MQDIWEADFRYAAGLETDNFSNLWLCVAIVYQITYHFFLLYKKKKKSQAFGILTAGAFGGGAKRVWL